MEERNGKPNRITGFFSAVTKLWNAQETLKLSNIRPAYLQYFFSFPLAMIFAMSEHYLLQGRADVFGLKFTTIGIIAFGLGAIVFFSVASIRNISTLSKVSSLLALVGFLPYLFLPDGTASFVCAVMLMAGIGGCVSLSSYSSGFVLNNTERFMGSVLILLFSGIVRIINDLFILPQFFMPAVMGVVAVGLMLSSFLCKSQDFDQEYSNRGRYNAAIWLVLFLFFSFFVTKSLGIHVAEFQMPNSDMIKGCAIVVAVALCLIVQLVFKRSIWTMCNVFFIATIGCYILNTWGEHTLADVVYGFKETGLLIAFYLIGCVTNRFSNFRMHKQLLFIMMPAIIPIYIIPDMLAGTKLSYPVAIGISSALFMVFLLLSPAFSTHLFFADWSDDLHHANMTNVKNQADQINQAVRSTLTLSEEASPLVASYNDFIQRLGALTATEREIFDLHLRGFSAQQISDERRCSLRTVRFHNKNIYSKLGIASRNELMLLAKMMLDSNVNR